MFLGGKPVEVLGKQYYRTADGQLIEMPSDMTSEQVIKLEADARAAVTRIGKGPAPKPVPDVRKLDKKQDKKTQLKSFGKGQKPGAAGKGSRKPQAGGSPTLSKVGRRFEETERCDKRQACPHLPSPQLFYWHLLLHQPTDY